MRGETAAPAPMGGRGAVAGGTLHPFRWRGEAAAGSRVPGLGQSYQITVAVNVISVLQLQPKQWY